MIVSVLFIIFVGLGGGITVGAGFVAFLTVMGIIPRLMQLTKTMRFVQAYEAAVILGAVCGGWETLHMNHLFLTKWIAVLSRAAGRFVCRDACGCPDRGFKCPADISKTNRAQK